MIIDGEVDKHPEAAFMMVGTIDEASQRRKLLKKHQFNKICK